MYFLAFFFRLLFLYVVCLAVYESFVLYRGGTKESWASIKILTSPADSVSRLFESTLGLWRLRCPFIYYVLWREREDYSIKSVIKPREMGGGGKFNLIADHWKLVSRKRAAFFLVVALYIYEMNIVSTLINAHSFEFDSGKLRCFDSSRVTSKKYHKWTQKGATPPQSARCPPLLFRWNKTSVGHKYPSKKSGPRKCITKVLWRGWILCFSLVEEGEADGGNVS